MRWWEGEKVCAQATRRGIGGTQEGTPGCLNVVLPEDMQRLLTGEAHPASVGETDSAFHADLKGRKAEGLDSERS